MEKTNHLSMAQRNIVLLNITRDVNDLIKNYFLSISWINGKELKNATILVWCDDAVLTKEYYEGLDSDCQLESYNSHYKSALVSTRGIKLNIKPASSWLVYDKTIPYPDMYKQWINFVADFKDKVGVPVMSSPSLTGLYLIEHMLPREKNYPQLPKDLSDKIRSVTTQARAEYLAHKQTKELERFYYYDGKLMYLAFADRELPCGYPVHDFTPVFQQFVPGWYRVEFTIPQRWHHIGLLPVKNEHGWWWPDYRYAGDTFETWCTELELRHAFKHNWKFEVRERILFEQDRPLRGWKNKLMDFRSRAVKDRTLGKLKRRIILESIGAMYTSTHRREFSCSFEEWPTVSESLSQEEQLNARIDSGKIFYSKQVHKTEEQEKFYMPHWTAYIWAYARVKLAHDMLKVRRDDLLGCYLDAIYTKTDVEQWLPERVDVTPGQFRLKGYINKSYPFPKNLPDLHKLSHIAEEGNLEQIINVNPSFRVKA